MPPISVPAAATAELPEIRRTADRRAGANGPSTGSWHISFDLNIGHEIGRRRD